MTSHDWQNTLFVLLPSSSLTAYSCNAVVQDASTSNLPVYFCLHDAALDTQLARRQSMSERIVKAAHERAGTSAIAFLVHKGDATFVETQLGLADEVMHRTELPVYIITTDAIVQEGTRISEIVRECIEAHRRHNVELRQPVSPLTHLGDDRYLNLRKVLDEART